MPVYSYRCPECGHVQEHMLGMADIHPEYMDCPCGKAMARRSIADDWRGRRQRGTPGNWPMISNALAVHSSQIQEAHEASVAAGCPTQFTEKGQPILTSQRHKAAYWRSRGVIDRDGGYGDYTGRSQSDARDAGIELAD